MKDKRILSRERGIALGPEAGSSSPGTMLALEHVELSPLAAPQGTFPTVKVGEEATDRLCHLTWDLTEYGGEKLTSPWALGL